MDLSNENVIHIKQDEIEYLQFRRLLEYKDKINRVYIIDEGVIKKEVDGVLKETTLREVLEMNLEGTPI